MLYVIEILYFVQNDMVVFSYYRIHIDRRTNSRTPN